MAMQKILLPQQQRLATDVIDGAAVVAEADAADNVAAVVVGDGDAEVGMEDDEGGVGGDLHHLLREFPHASSP